MTFPNPTRLSKMTEPELQSEIEYRMEGMWEKPENRERIDEVYKELNRRGRRAVWVPVNPTTYSEHPKSYEKTNNQLGQKTNSGSPGHQRQGR